MAKSNVSRVFFSYPLHQGKNFLALARHPNDTSKHVFGPPKIFRLGVAQLIFLILCVHFLLHGGLVLNFFLELGVFLGVGYSIIP